MFEFENIIRSENGHVLSAHCRIDRASAFFEGHFEEHPLMPAAAQLEMIEACIRLGQSGRIRIKGGRALKFVQQIQPADQIKLLFEYRNETMVNFVLQKEDASLASKGNLTLTGETMDD